MDLMDRTMVKYEQAYYDKWLRLPDDFKSKMLNGIVAFQIDVTDIQGKAKLSQNKTAQEIENIISGLASSTMPNESIVAAYMDKYARKGPHEVGNKSAIFLDGKNVVKGKSVS